MTATPAGTDRHVGSGLQPIEDPRPEPGQLAGAALRILALLAIALLLILVLLPAALDAQAAIWL